MREHGVQEGDRIQACYVEVDGMNAPRRIWVVVAHSGLVISISEPPVGQSISGWHPPVHLRSEHP